MNKNLLIELKNDVMEIPQFAEIVDKFCGSYGVNQLPANIWEH